MHRINWLTYYNVVYPHINAMETIFVHLARIRWQIQCVDLIIQQLIRHNNGANACFSLFTILHHINTAFRPPIQTMKYVYYSAIDTICLDDRYTRNCEYFIYVMYAVNT